jgi:hypothetical protein
MSQPKRAARKEVKRSPPVASANPRKLGMERRVFGMSLLTVSYPTVAVGFLASLLPVMGSDAHTQDWMILPGKI